MKKLFYISLLFLIITTAAAVLSDESEKELLNGIVRLHIIADSDSEYDQAVKLALRDEIQDKVKKTGDTDIKTIEALANDYLSRQNIPYRARAQYGKYTFPKKEYKNIVLPEGEYMGVKLTLGSGSGHNWWCVLYPPMCFNESEKGEISVESLKMLTASLSDATADIIIERNGSPTVKFKIVELIRELRSLG